MSKNSLVDMFQSLLVAFVLAMVFRGFVIEGFVIPTGSMAPTLLGQHLLLRSGQTGVESPVGLDQSYRDVSKLRDFSVGRHEPMKPPASALRPRAGDRVLVLKTLYPFRTPDRWDVTVFRNPTQPEGDAANFIKRLVGLPGESIWLVDGDVFIKPAGGTEFEVARKPEHVQKGVWQRVHDGGRMPAHPESLVRTQGPPWKPDPKDAWVLDGATWRHDDPSKATLTWDDRRIPLNDWTAYNMFNQRALFPVSDLRVSGAVQSDAPDGSVQFDLTTRSHVFQFALTHADSTIAMWPVSNPEDRNEVRSDTPGLVQGRSIAVEFEHRDQMMVLRLDGREVSRLPYNWTPRQRLEFATGLIDSNMTDYRLTAAVSQTPKLQWTVEGTPVALSSIAVDRDLHHRRATYQRTSRSQPAPDGREDQLQSGQDAAATSPASIVTLSDDQFFMLGDNSSHSNDGRLWGWPHPLVAELIDDDPFVVNRDLLVGKAFVVYFPASHALTKNGTGFVPDFGRLRFIR